MGRIGDSHEVPSRRGVPPPVVWRTAEVTAESCGRSAATAQNFYSFESLIDVEAAGTVVYVLMVELRKLLYKRHFQYLVCSQ